MNPFTHHDFSQPEVAEIERAIQRYLRASLQDIGAEQIGPFLAGFHPRSDNPYRNYAIPDDGAQPSTDDVAELISAFERRERKPRLEYVPDLAPAVEPALLTAGFEVEGRLPLMICGSSQQNDGPLPAGIELRVAADDDDLLGMLTVQHEAYGEQASPTAEDVAGLRGSVSAGAVCVLALDSATGEPAGAGMFPPPHFGTSEIAGIGVRTQFRRRGIARAVTARLVQEARKIGVGTPFLMAESEDTARIYARVGFQKIAEILHISH